MAGPTTTGLAALAAGEGWRYVGGSGQPAFENSWSNASPGDPKMAFRIREAGVVDIQGLVSGGASGTYVFTLPEGYRPAYDCYIPLATTSPDFAYMKVHSDGGVELVKGTGPVMVYAQVFLDPPAVA